MKDYIPQPDPAFHLWQAAFVSAVNGNLAGYGLVAADLTPVTAAQTAWAAALPAHETAANAAKAARAAKDDARETLEDAIRIVGDKIRATPTVTDAMRAAAGMTVPGSNPTPSGPPTTAPAGEIDTSVRLRHTVHFTDALSEKKAKPPGVRGCEIWMKVGAPAPVSEADVRFVALDSRTPYVVQFDGGDAGKPVWYWLRWSSTRGEPGPWGAPVSATVPG
ncbi:MAG: hypothetical protein ACRC33_20590 [Gemmataceae bacterium]